MRYCRQPWTWPRARPPNPALDAADEHRRDALPTLAKRAFGREQMKGWCAGGSPQAELDFKFYRQATNKIGGISAAAARFLERFLWEGAPAFRGRD